MFLYKHFVPGHEKSTELEDIVRNIGFVLRTKRGCGYFLPSFGLSDGGYRTPEEMVEGMSKEIAENIRLFEPRVEFVDVDESYDDDGRRATLVVNLRPRGADDKLRIVIDLQRNTFDVVVAKPEDE